MPILFAGGEDIDFVTTGDVTVNQNEAYFVSGRTRSAMLLRGSSTAIIAVLDSPAAIFSVGARAWFSGTPGTTMMQFISGGLVVASIATTSTGLVQILVRDGVGNLSVATTSTIPLLTNARLKIDVSCVFATAGSIRVFVEGLPLVAFSGNTLNSFSASTTIDRVGLMCATTDYTTWCEVLVATADTRAMTLNTLAPFSLHQNDWTGAVGDISEVTSNLTTKITTAASGLTFSYNVPPLPSGTMAFAQVRSSALASTDGSEPNAVGTGVLSGSAETLDGLTPLTAMPKRVVAVYPIDPSTNRAWTAATINNLKFQFRSGVAAVVADGDVLLLDDGTALYLEDGSTLSLASDAAGIYPLALTLVNPGAESGSMTGWSAIQSQSIGAVGSGGTDRDQDPADRTGSYHFIAAAAAATSWWGQTVAIPDAAIQDVDAGILDFEGEVYQQGYSGDDDLGGLAVECFDANGVWLAGRFTDLVDSKKWTKLAASIPVPSGTRSLRISVRGYRLGGTQISAYFDDFAARLTQRAKAATLLFSMEQATTSGWSGTPIYAYTTTYGDVVTAWSSQATPDTYRSLPLPGGLVSSIDAGAASFQFYCQQSSYGDNNDPGRAYVQFKDGSGNNLGSPVYTTANFVTAPVYFGPQSIVAQIPAGARQAVVGIQGNRASGSDCDAYFARMAAFIIA